MASGMFIVASHRPSAATGGATSHSAQLTSAGDHAHAQTRRRPDDRDQELGPRRGRLAGDVRHAAQQEQADRAHRNAERARHRARGPARARTGWPPTAARRPPPATTARPARSPRRRLRNVENATYTSSASNSSQLQLAVNWMPNSREQAHRRLLARARAQPIAPCQPSRPCCRPAWPLVGRTKYSTISDHQQRPDDQRRRAAGR